MPVNNDHLSQELVEQILMKLGFSAPPPISIAGLSSLYRAWCHKVPFDNILKRIHLAAGNPAPLPGYDDTDFYKKWLRYGVGGLCWSGNGALHALLKALGFSSRIGTATMVIDDKQPPNHGTVTVQIENQLFLVDASMMHNTPLPLDSEHPSAIDHPAWGLTCTPNEGKWLIQCRLLHMPDGCPCRIEDLSVSRNTFRQLNEVTRTLSPFNNSLYVRLNVQESVLGISAGMAVNFTPSGEMHTTLLSPQDRHSMLVDVMGISEEIIYQIVPDV